MDYIKYDTEGAEHEALAGSEQQLQNSTPYLRVSVYHKSEDMFSLLLWLNETLTHPYDFYLRRQRCIPAWECDLIAVPRKARGEKGENDA